MMVKKSSTSGLHTRYNKSNLIRKYCYHYCKACGNDSHRYELDGTQWLNPQGGKGTRLPPKSALLEGISVFLF